MQRVDASLAVGGRTRDEVELVAVSKTVSLMQVLAAIDAGYRVFGENRPQELHRKLKGLELVQEARPVRFDMIGNLQTNKINAVLGRVELIHSIGTMHLAEAVSSRASRRLDAGELAAPQRVLIEVNVSGEETKGGFSPDELRRSMDELQNLCGIRIEGLMTMAAPQRVLIEVNVSGEETKGGFSPDELRRSMDELQNLCGIRIEGLMTMAPRGDKSRARECFAGLRGLRDELRVSSGLELRELSCGLSEDYEIALEEGSTIVRLGRVVFDPSFEVL